MTKKRTGSQYSRGQHPNSKAQLKGGDTGKGFGVNKGSGAPKTQNILRFISECVDREVKPAQINVACGALLDLSLAELERVSDKAKQGNEPIPIMVGILAQRLATDYRNGDTDTIFRLIEQVAGKPRQALEVESKLDINPLALDKLTGEQLEQLALQLEAILAKDAQGGA